MANYGNSLHIAISDNKVSNKCWKRKIFIKKQQWDTQSISHCLCLMGLCLIIFYPNLWVGFQLRRGVGCLRQLRLLQGRLLLWYRAQVGCFRGMSHRVGDSPLQGYQTPTMGLAMLPSSHLSLCQEQAYLRVCPIHDVYIPMVCREHCCSWLRIVP